MHKPGDIIYSKPGFAIMAIGDDEYIFGDKVKKVPADVLCGVEMAVLWSSNRPADSVLETTDLTILEAMGYALAMLLFKPSQRMAAFLALQRNTRNLFQTLPYIEEFMVAQGSGVSLPEMDLFHNILSEFKP